MRLKNSQNATHIPQDSMVAAVKIASIIVDYYNDACKSVLCNLSYKHGIRFAGFLIVSFIHCCILHILKSGHMQLYFHWFQSGFSPYIPLSLYTVLVSLIREVNISGVQSVYKWPRDLLSSAYQYFKVVSYDAIYIVLLVCNKIT